VTGLVFYTVGGLMLLISQFNCVSPILYVIIYSFRYAGIIWNLKNRKKMNL